MSEKAAPVPADATDPSGVGDSPHTLRSWLLALGALGVLTLSMFGSVLFAPEDRVLSNRTTDLFMQFSHWRAFGFGELRHGNLALWNPHLFSGAPYFGGFQSALLYPPNALFLMLPLAQAINWSIALHVFLAGAFTYAWTAHRRLHPLACLLSAVMFMFCGAHFLHIYAGHLPNLCTLVWAPLLFLAIDGLFEEPVLSWSLLGMFAVAMQVLAGHPQYVFCTCVAAGTYCALCCLNVRERGRFLFCLSGMVLGGAALSAVQLLTALGESGETLRSVGLPYDFAAMFSFPPENFLTLLAPNVFGDMKSLPYWGRCYLWEMSLFLSVTGLVLAVAGAIWGDGQRRRFALAMVLVLFVLALGVHTPMFKLLYHFVPGFNKFRGVSKFIFLASLFLALLAAVGLDLLLRRWRLPRVFVCGVGGAALLCAAGALWLRQIDSAAASQESVWQKLMLAVPDTEETYVPAPTYSDPDFVWRAAARASNSLFLAAGTLALAAGLLFVAGTGQRAALLLLLLLATAELFWFARTSLEDFVLSDAADSGVTKFLANKPGDYRILNLADPPDSALSNGAKDIWGYDPGVLRRYAEFLAFTQDQDPSQASQFPLFSRLHALFGMLRLRFTFVPGKDGIRVRETANAMPRLQLVSRFQVIARRDEIFAVLSNAAFNPREEAILETAPRPEPVPATDPGAVKLLDSSTDRLTIEADVKSPCLLLITDTYAKGWRARSEPGSVQAAYEIMPADYCLRAIPLAAGHHRLRVEYLPWGFVLGKWLSIGAVILFLALLVWHSTTWSRMAQSPGSRNQELT